MPKLTDGNPQILDKVDASPFFGFGDVYPGQTVQVGVAKHSHLYASGHQEQSLLGANISSSGQIDGFFAH
jgi:hypothetical protein